MSQKALFDAILEDEKDTVNEILNKNEDLIKAKNEDKLSPLAFAVVEGADKSVEVLIKHHANPNEEIKEGPLKGEHIIDLAAERYDPKVAKVLVSAAPNLQITNKAVIEADKHGDKETLAEICKRISSNPTAEQKHKCEAAERRVKLATNEGVNRVKTQFVPSHVSTARAFGPVMGHTNGRTGFARNTHGIHVEGARGGRRHATRAKRSKKTRKSKSRKSRR